MKFVKGTFRFLGKMKYVITHISEYIKIGRQNKDKIVDDESFNELSSIVSDVNEDTETIERDYDTYYSNNTRKQKNKGFFSKLFGRSDKIVDDRYIDEIDKIAKKNSLKSDEIYSQLDKYLFSSTDEEKQKIYDHIRYILDNYPENAEELISEIDAIKNLPEETRYIVLKTSVEDLIDKLDGKKAMRDKVEIEEEITGVNNNGEPEYEYTAKIDNDDVVEVIDFDDLSKKNASESEEANKVVNFDEFKNKNNTTVSEPKKAKEVIIDDNTDEFNVDSLDKYAEAYQNGLMSNEEFGKKLEEYHKKINNINNNVKDDNGAKKENEVAKKEEKVEQEKIVYVDASKKIDLPYVALCGISMATLTDMLNKQELSESDLVSLKSELMTIKNRYSSETSPVIVENYKTVMNAIQDKLNISNGNTVTLNYVALNSINMDRFIELLNKDKLSQSELIILRNELTNMKNRCNSETSPVIVENYKVAATALEKKLSM